MKINDKTMQNNYTSPYKCIKSQVISVCDGDNIKSSGIKGSVVAKIPVVLGEKDIKIDLEVNMELQNNLYKIREIKNEIVIIENTVISMMDKKQNENLESARIFLKGYVRKNLEYYTLKEINLCKGNEGKNQYILDGDIKYTIVDVPFSCVTEIKYDTDVKFLNSQHNETCIREIKVKEDGKCEQEFLNTIIYEDKPYCEVVNQRVIANDSCKKMYICNTMNKYNILKENIVLCLKARVLQIQEVKIDSSTFSKDIKC